MSQFGNYTRSTAFNLTMSQEAIVELLDMEVLLGCEPSSDSPSAGSYGLALERKGLIAYLHRRGLIAHSTVPTCEDNWVLTPAGKLLCPLLKEAGFAPAYTRVEDACGRAYVQRLAKVGA